MVKLIEAKDLPEKDKLYFKKDLFGWRIVNPIKDPETNKINWTNLFFGGKRNLFFLIIILLMIGTFVFVYSNDMNAIIQYYQTKCAGANIILSE